jgi:hypothetical protein
VKEVKLLNPNRVRTASYVQIHYEQIYNYLPLFPRFGGRLVCAIPDRLTVDKYPHGNGQRFGDFDTRKQDRTGDQKETEETL